jgi:hypothetical protein
MNLLATAEPFCVYLPQHFSAPFYLMSCLRGFYLY